MRPGGSNSRQFRIAKLKLDLNFCLYFFILLLFDMNCRVGVQKSRRVLGEQGNFRYCFSSMAMQNTSIISESIRITLNSQSMPFQLLLN